MKNLIDQLRAQLAAATSGPWGQDHRGIFDKDEEVYLATVEGPDAKLIVTLRNNANTLLDYIEKLEAENKNIKSTVDAWAAIEVERDSLLERINDLGDYRGQRDSLLEEMIVLQEKLNQADKDWAKVDKEKWALIDRVEKLEADYEAAFKRGLKEGKGLADKVIVHNQKLSAVVIAARNANRLLNEWDLIRQNSYAHEQLTKSIAALDEGMK